MNVATMTDELKEVYDEDVRVRKADVMAGKNRVTKGGKGSKGVTFYSDMLRGKAKKEYTQAGEVKVSSPYQENILPYEEWKLFDSDKKKLVLGELLKFHTRAEIGEVWGRKNLDNMVYRWGFADKLRSRGEMGAKRVKQQSDTASVPLSKSALEELFAFVLRLHLSETDMKGSAVAQKIKSFASFINGDGLYEMSITTTEVFKET